MTDAGANLILAVARGLYVNGQATDQTVSAAERLGRARGLRATIIPRWGELRLVALRAAAFHRFYMRAESPRSRPIPRLVERWQW